MESPAADTTVIIVLTSTSIVTPNAPSPATPANTPATTPPPGESSIDGATYTTILITSESTVEVTPTAPTPTSANPSDAAATSGASTSGGPGSLSGQPNKLQHTNELSTSAKIAMGVAIPCGVLLLLALFGCFFWKRRKRSQALREKRLTEIHEYSYNPNMHSSNGGGSGAGMGGGAGINGKERPDSMATLNGIGGKSLADEQPNTASAGNYRGWGPTPEDVAPVVVGRNNSGNGNNNSGTGNSAGLIPTTPQPAQTYMPNNNRQTQNPIESPQQTLGGPNSPAASSQYYQSPQHQQQHQFQNQYQSPQYNQYQSPTPNQNQFYDPASPPPATAITSDQVIQSQPSPSLNSNSPPPNMNMGSNPPPTNNNAPQRIYDQSNGDVNGTTHASGNASNNLYPPVANHQQQYSSLYSPTPEESRRVASNF